ncbi:hypothetical protein [Micromonospora rosaria]|uniref:hypothetical protein n=1 Tax=Micromonospora rosaria TaxID=47874 RepID=UPI001B80D3B1|nr:hypothetical protein [Micromonospora rosaria]
MDDHRAGVTTPVEDDAAALDPGVTAAATSGVDRRSTSGTASPAIARTAMVTTSPVTRRPWGQPTRSPPGGSGRRGVSGAGGRTGRSAARAAVPAGQRRAAARRGRSAGPRSGTSTRGVPAEISHVDDEASRRCTTIGPSARPADPVRVTAEGPGTASAAAPRVAPLAAGVSARRRVSLGSAGHCS